VPTQISYPGVYVEEIDSGVHSIEGVSTSTTGFIGVTRKGPFTTPVCVHSFSAFTNKFGALLQNAELGYAVRQFFLNGGKCAHIVRVAREPNVSKVKKALRALNNSHVSLLVLPGITDLKILAAAEEFCRQHRAFLIMDLPANAKVPADVLQAQQAGQ
jgi:uncharacterized protein